MKKTIHYSLFLPLILACTFARSAAALGSCRAPDSYIDGVDKLIDGAVGRTADLALTVLPSFEAEYGVRLVGNEVYLVQLRSSFWASSVVWDGPKRYRHDFRKARVRTTVLTASLRHDVAMRVRQKYVDAISASKDSDSRGLDGTIYRFADQAVGCGQTWSPPAQSDKGKLVDLAELLALHARQTGLLSLRLSEEKILGVLLAKK